MFDRLIHADWSISPARRWAAVAEHQAGRWQVTTPALVGGIARFLADAFAAGEKERVLLGFDFPIGLPSAYGALTGLGNFQEALPVVGNGVPWARFFDVCERGEDVSLYRPFYPQVSRKGVSPGSLVSGIGVTATDDLLRICERRTATRQAACSLFWTLGGNQVGKAAIAGWREVVRLADPVRLRALGLGPRVVNILDRAVELLLVPLRAAAELSAAIGQHPAELDLVLVIEGHDPVIEQVGGGDRGLAIVELGTNATLA